MVLWDFLKDHHNCHKILNYEVSKMFLKATKVLVVEFFEGEESENQNHNFEF